jgi:hypothetical protein
VNVQVLFWKGVRCVRIGISHDNLLAGCCGQPGRRGGSSPVGRFGFRM